MRELNVGGQGKGKLHSSWRQAEHSQYQDLNTEAARQFEGSCESLEGTLRRPQERNSCNRFGYNSGLCRQKLIDKQLLEAALVGLEQRRSEIDRQLAEVHGQFAAGAGASLGVSHGERVGETSNERGSDANASGGHAPGVGPHSVDIVPARRRAILQKNWMIHRHFGIGKLRFTRASVASSLAHH